MAEFRKWTLHFDDGNNLIDGKRVQDPPGFAAGGGKELVSVSEMLAETHSTNQSATLPALWIAGHSRRKQQTFEHGCGPVEAETAGCRCLQSPAKHVSTP